MFRVFFRLFIVFCVLFNTNCDQTTNPKRNALIILADDAGFQMGTYGNKYCQTPNLDALAKESLIFHNAYTSVSSCSPSRAALLTGLPSHQNGMYGLHQGQHHFNAFDKIQSLPQILASKGIRTGIIGKKHVGPDTVFKFDYEQTEEHHSILQVGRNITFIKDLVREFLQDSQKHLEPFFLFVSFHDPHRCGHTHPEYGSFCEKFGNGEPGMGYIPDWIPIYYQPENFLNLPYFIPDTVEAKLDLAAMFTTMSRLDQGVHLVLEELKRSNFYDNTLVLFTSDNGIPFPNGRTNLYDSGIGEPMFIRSPIETHRRNQVTYSLTSLLDVTPTLLDWFQVTDDIGHLTGHSLMPLLSKEPENVTNEVVFASHNLHEVTMYYPMRMIRTQRYKLIHNLNYYSPYPIDQDLYMSPTFQDILNRTKRSEPLQWFKNLDQYYFRPEWELYDLKHDPEETRNLYRNKKYVQIFDDLSGKLNEWQDRIDDPWLCAPHQILEAKLHPKCCDVHNLKRGEKFVQNSYTSDNIILQLV